jgi:hypothetical protein
MSDDDLDLTAIDAEIDLLLIKLSACASVVVERLRRRIDGVKGVLGVLAGIDTPWAEASAQRLQQGLLQARIRKEAREGRILLGLPENTEEAIRAWLRSVRLVDENSDWLSAAVRYGL